MPGKWTYKQWSMRAWTWRSGHWTGVGTWEAPPAYITERPDTYRPATTKTEIYRPRQEARDVRH